MSNDVFYSQKYIHVYSIHIWMEVRATLTTSNITTTDTVFNIGCKKQFWGISLTYLTVYELVSTEIMDNSY